MYMYIYVAVTRAIKCGLHDVPKARFLIIITAPYRDKSGQNLLTAGKI